MRKYAINNAKPVNLTHPLNRGLVSWWLCVPGNSGGVVWRDLMRRTDGTLTAMTPPSDWVGPKGWPGAFGALDMDATDDSVTFLNGSWANIGTGNVSFTFRFMLPTAAAGKCLLSFNYGAGIGSDFWDLKTRTGVKIRNRQRVGSSGTGEILSNLTIASAVWYQVFIVRVGTVTKMYINGLLDNSLTSAENATPISDDAYIGSSNDGAEPVGGYVDDYRIWRREVSAAEVAEYWRLSRNGYRGLLNYVEPIDGLAAAAVPTDFVHRLMMMGVGI